jgi:uncharacterized protein HemX
MNYTNKNNNIIGTNNITINEKRPRRSSPQIPSSANKYFLLVFILFILIIGILSVVLIKRKNRINNLKDNLRIKEKSMVEIQNENNQTVTHFNKILTELNKQNNETVKQLNGLLSEKNATIEQLNKTLIEIKQERSRINNHKNK